MWFTRRHRNVLLVVAGFYLLISFMWAAAVARHQRTLMTDQLRSHLYSTIRLWIAQWPTDDSQPFAPDSSSHLRQLREATGLRFTVVSLDGRPLADSHPAAPQEDLPAAPEIAAARRAGVGESQRTTSSDGSRRYFVAVRVDRERQPAVIARVSGDLRPIDASVAATQRHLWSLIVLGAVVGVPIGFLTLRYLERPLAELTNVARSAAKGDFGTPISLKTQLDLGEFGQAFRQLQEALAQQVRRLHREVHQLNAVVSAMDEGVIAVDSSLRVTLANQASKRMLGIASPTPAGKPLVEVAGNMDIHAMAMEALQKGQVCQREVTMQQPAPRILQVLAAPLADAPDTGAVIMLHDLTELRRLEGMRRDFVANVSHELKTPLASITACAETLRMGAIHDPQHNMRFVEQIEQEAARLHQLIVDLLELSRVQSGQRAFRLAELPLGPILRASLDRFQQSAEQQGIQLHHAAPAEDLVVWMDRRSVETILDNLLDNAVKYTPSGGTVTLKWSADDRHISIEVADTGIGIPPEEQERIFERFYRVDKARSRKLGGTGLGLAIVKHLAQALGGQVTVNSREGEGSVFRVTLPRKPATTRD